MNFNAIKTQYSRRKATKDLSELPAIGGWPHRVIVPILLAVAAALTITSLVGDSITFDETSHLTSGYSYLKTGDFRLAPDHPPLAKVWCALPLLLIDNKWPPPETNGWRDGDVWKVGRGWLFDLNNGERIAYVFTQSEGDFWGLGRDCWHLLWQCSAPRFLPMGDW